MLKESLRLWSHLSDLINEDKKFWVTAENRYIYQILGSQ